MSRFEVITSSAVLPQKHLPVSAHLQSYEILRLIKNMMEDHKNRLSEQAAASQQVKMMNSTTLFLPCHLIQRNDADELEAIGQICDIVQQSTVGMWWDIVRVKITARSLSANEVKME
jgi:hypothetical protein